MERQYTRLGGTRAMALRYSAFILATLLLTLAFPSLGRASATNIYIAQTAQGSGDGSSCANARAYTFFNTSGSWGSGTTQIGPGTTVHVCGVITFASGATGLTFQGSGASGNPVTLYFEAGAALKAPYWSGGGSNTGGAIVMNGVSYVTVDGGTNGLVEATLNGTPGGACPGGTCNSTAHDGNGVMFRNCTNCTLKNLEVGPIYLRTSTSDESSASTVGCRVISKEGTCNNCTITNNKLHGASTVIFFDLASGSNTNLVVSDNDIYDTPAGVILAQGNGSTGTLASFSFYGNSVHDFYTWNDSSGYYNFHHDGIHIWTYTAALGGINIYNNHFYGDFGTGTAWIYYEQYGSGTGAMNVFNNLFDFDASTENGGGASHTIEFEGNATTSDVYNNTIYGTQLSGSIASGIYMNGTTATPDIRNNIIGGYLANLIEGSAPASTSNNNVYDMSAGGQLNNGSFSAWKSYCGCDSVSRSVAPGLDANYTISSTSSSAYQEGQNLTNQPNSSINTDLAGIVRSSTGSWDAGAYSFAGTLPAPPTSLTVTVH